MAGGSWFPNFRKKKGNVVEQQPTLENQPQQKPPEVLAPPTSISIEEPSQEDVGLENIQASPQELLERADALEEKLRKLEENCGITGDTDDTDESFSSSSLDQNNEETTSSSYNVGVGDLVDIGNKAAEMGAAVLKERQEKAQRDLREKVAAKKARLSESVDEDSEEQRGDSSLSGNVDEDSEQQRGDSSLSRNVDESKDEDSEQQQGDSSLSESVDEDSEQQRGDSSLSGNVDESKDEDSEQQQGDSSLSESVDESKDEDSGQQQGDSPLSENTPKVQQAPVDSEPNEVIEGVVGAVIGELDSQEKEKAQRDLKKLPEGP